MWKSQQYVSDWGQGCVQWMGVGCQVGRVRVVSSGSGWGCQVGGVWCVSNGVEQDRTVSRVPNH